MFGRAVPELLLFGGLGFPEIVLILLLVFLIFGASRIPELGRGLGEGIKNFKKAVKGEDDEKP
jgi:sec-independent protein translocase protein TatA